MCLKLLKQLVIKIVPLSLKQGGDVMSEGAISIKKAIPIIVVTWILSLVTALAIAYFTPFAPIGTDQIGDSAVTADKVVDGAIITTKLADGTVTSAKILDATITAEDIASGSIITVKVADEAITTAKIADDSVTTVKIADGAIVTVKLADETVTSEKIADGDVNTADLANNAVTKSKIVDNAIVTVKLADGSVTSAKILDGTIVAADLATGAVTSIKIADGAVTTSKIADYAVTNLKLAAGAIPYNSTVVFTEQSITLLPYDVDMPYTSVNVTLYRPSQLIIMFSSEARTNLGNQINLWAQVSNETHTMYAQPDAIYFTQPDVDEYASYTYNFLYFAEEAGVYKIQMRWGLDVAGTGYVYFRTLTVIALPA